MPSATRNWKKRSSCSRNRNAECTLKTILFILYTRLKTVICANPTNKLLMQR
mgnify:CR=1 FL=1